VRLVILTMLPLALAAVPGCVLTDLVRETARQTKTLYTPRPTDYRDTTEEPSDEWAFVGEDARGNQPREVDPDPWWKQKVMSQKARDIERNLGFD
jgi:hypothetical protein